MARDRSPESPIATEAGPNPKDDVVDLLRNYRPIALGAVRAAASIASSEKQASTSNTAFDVRLLPESTPDWQ